MDKKRLLQQRALLGALLRDLRRKQGVRQSVLAEQLGVTQSLVSNYESGQRRIDVLELRELCAVLGVPLEEVLRQLEQRLAGA
ncbi:MAG TPA: helix-turn-helix transcriptional regulator [Chloroflexota bacterium]